MAHFFVPAADRGRGGDDVTAKTAKLNLGIAARKCDGRKRIAAC